MDIDRNEASSIVLVLVVLQRGRRERRIVEQKMTGAVVVGTLL